MDELVTAFTLGNAAILTNACLLPLYPGLIAFLAGNAGSQRTKSATRWLGLVVLAGILTMMLLIGLILYLLKGTFGQVLAVLLPLIYGLVILMGLFMLSGHNPFARLATAQAPALRNPYMTAYLYGLLFGPMTLPCTGPIITTAFALGAREGGSLAFELLYFLVFGVGFGWPLVLLPFFAQAAQRRFVRLLARNHEVLNRASGVLLIAVGLFGIVTELLPQWIPGTDLDPAFWWVYWAAVVIIMLGIGFYTYRQHNPPQPPASASAGEHP